MSVPGHQQTSGWDDVTSAVTSRADIPQINLVLADSRGGHWKITPDIEAETKPLDLPVGQITSTSRIIKPSSPSRENIPLALSGKSVM